MKTFSADNRRLQIVLQPEPEGGFTVTVPALPGCITYGKDFNEALKMARDAASAYLEDMVAEGETLPSSALSFVGEIEVPSLAKVNA